MGWTETVELWMCRLAGLPVSESWDRPPGPPTLRQIAVTSCVVCGYAVAAVSFATLLDPEETTAFEMYAYLIQIVFPVSAVFVTLNMASGDRSAPKRLAVRAECLREAMTTRGVGVAATNLCRTASRILLGSVLLTFCYECVKDGCDTYFLYKESAPNHDRAFSALLTAFGIPANLLFWTVLYRSASQPLAELGVIEDVMRELPTEPEPEAEDEPGPEPEPEEDPGRPRPRPPSLTVHRCRLLIALCDQANKLRLESNRWLHVPSCVMTIHAAWFFPIVLWGLGTETEHFFYASLDAVYTAMGFVAVMAPLCCAQLVKHRREVLVQKADREAKRAEDPELRRALNKLKIHAEEMFPDSLCVLMDFDLSLFPVLLNVVVLVTTTFFQREEA